LQKKLKKNGKRARAHTQARAGERASQSWPKLAQNNQSYPKKVKNVVLK
jgi:hypothetical protein